MQCTELDGCCHALRYNTCRKEAFNTLEGQIWHFCFKIALFSLESRQRVCVCIRIKLLNITLSKCTEELHNLTLTRGAIINFRILTKFFLLGCTHVNHMMPCKNFHGPTWTHEIHETLNFSASQIFFHQAVYTA